MPFFPQFSSLFVPPFIPTIDLVLHLDAESGVTITNDYVTSWEDQGPSGNNFTGNYATRLTNAINGHSAIYFNGNDSYLTSPSTLLDNCNQLSIVAVWQVAYSANKGIFGTSDYRDIEITSDPSMRVRNDNYADTLFSEVSWFDNDSWSISSFVGEGGSGQIFKNGTEITDGVNGTTVELPTRNGITYDLGRYAYPAYELYAEFYLAEFYIYRKRLTNTERSDLENALNTKYDIY